MRENAYTTCETDIADECVLDHIFDQLRRKMQDLEDVLGRASGFEGIRDAFRSEWSLGRGLEDDRITSQKSRKQRVDSS